MRNYFTMEVPDYKVQPRDILYVSVKAQTPEGALTEMLNDRPWAQAHICRAKHSNMLWDTALTPRDA